MLRNINQENWPELEVFMGSAEHVPEAVIGLLSENEQDFEASYWKLDNYVVVQGDLFSAAAVLPQYLEEVVLRAKFKERVIDLIWQIGTGSSTDSYLQQTCFTESSKVLKI